MGDCQFQNGSSLLRLSETCHDYFWSLGKLPYVADNKHWSPHCKKYSYFDRFVFSPCLLLSILSIPMQDSSLTGAAAVPFLLSPKATSHANPSLRFDVVTLRSTETTTFTKGYGKHAGRAGPVILLTDDGERRVSDENLGRFPSGLTIGPDGREVRWFSDREMLRLHGFPEGFDFPDDITARQRCALIGNSVNVEVVALLLRRMLLEANAEGGREDGVGDLATADV